MVHRVPTQHSTPILLLRLVVEPEPPLVVGLVVLAVLVPMVTQMVVVA